MQKLILSLLGFIVIFSLSLQKTKVFLYTRARAHRLITVFGLVISLFVFLSFMSPFTVDATSAADTLNFQARLENSNGAIVADGCYNVEFKIYTVSSGGSALWTEDYLNSATPPLNWIGTACNGTEAVRVSNGYLTVNLGSVTSFPGTIPWGQQLYLGINIGGTGSTPSWDGEMTPRLALTSVPYAFQAQSATELQTTNGSNTATLSFASPSQNESITIPNTTTTDAICLETLANCTGQNAGSGDGNYIWNSYSYPGGTYPQQANFNIQSGSTTTSTGIIEALGSQTSDLLTFENPSGNKISGINSSGEIYYESGGNQAIIAPPQTPLSTTVDYYLPNISTSQTICTSAGNCANAGGGITGSGTQNYVAYFNTSSGNNVAASSQLYDYETGTAATSYIDIGGSTSDNAQLGVVGQSPSLPSLYIQSGVSNSAGATLLIKAGSGQTGSLASFENSSGSVVASFDTSGDLNAVNGIFSGNIQVTGSSSLGTVSYSAATANTDSLVCQNSGGQLATCSTSGSSGVPYVQGGNAFGTTGILGTTDNNGLNVITNGHTVLSLSNSGSAVFQNSSNSTTAFQVENTSGTPSVILDVDTSDLRLGIGTISPQGELQVQNQSASNAALIVEGASGQTGNLLSLENSTGQTLAYFDSNGSLNAIGTAPVFGALAIPTGVSASLNSSASTLSVGTTYYYVVTATNGISGNETTASSVVSNTPTLANPSIKIAWNQVTGATGYNIYRNTSNSFTSGSLLLTSIPSGSTLSYIDTGSSTTSGVPPSSGSLIPYAFDVKGYGGGNAVFVSGYGALYAAEGANFSGPNGTSGSVASWTVNVKQSANYNGVLINTSTSGLQSLLIADANNDYLSTFDKNGQYSTYGTNTSLNNLAVPTQTTTSTGSSYYYVITATNGQGETTQSNSVGMSNDTSTITWNQVTGATGYKIYRNTTNSFTSGSLLRTTITNGSTTSYTDTGGSTSAGLPPTAPTGTTLKLTGWNAQSADLQDWDNASGSVLAKIDSQGDLTAVNGNLTGTLGVSGAATFSASGTALTVNNNATILGNVSVGSSGNDGELILYDNTSTNSVTLDEAASPTSAVVIHLPDTAGTVCLQNSTACGFASSAGSSAAYMQGGNAFGVVGTLGTTDSNNLNIEANGHTGLTVISGSSYSNVGINTTSAINGATLSVKAQTSQVGQVIEGASTDATLTSELPDNPAQNTDCSGSGWNNVGGGSTTYTHASGGATVLTCSFTGNVPPTNGTVYEVVYSTSLSSGSDTVTPNIAGANGTASTGTINSYSVNITAGSSGAQPTFTLSSSTDTATISNIQVYIYPTTATLPVLQVYNSSPADTLDIRSSGSNTNSFIGLNSGQYNASGSIQNTAVGSGSFQSNTLGSNDTSLGYGALQNNLNGSTETAIGSLALQANKSGQGNTAVGYASENTNVSGNDNVSVGQSALRNITTGSWNTAIGFDAEQVYNVNGVTALGYFALEGNTASNIVGIGTDSLQNNTGNDNTGLGYNSGLNNTSGANNTFIGYFSGYEDSNYSTDNFATPGGLQNATAIGAFSQVQVNNAVVLGSVDKGSIVGVGTTIPLNTFSVSPLDYSTGTAQQTSGSGTITGSGTNWTSAMVGDEMIFSDGQYETITSWTSATQITGSSTTITEASGTHYRLHHIGLQVTSSGAVGVNTASTLNNGTLSVLGQYNQVGEVVEGSAGQDIIDFYSSTPTKVAYIDSAGDLTAVGGTFSSTLNANGGLSVNSTNVISNAGILQNAALSGTYSNALTFSNASNSFTGNGSGLTNLNASNLATGTVPTGVVSGNYGSITGTGSLSSGSIGTGFGTISTGNSIQGNTLAATAANGLTLGTSSSHTGGIVFYGSGGSGTLTLVGPTTPNTGNYTLTIPTITANDTICTNGQIASCSNYAAASTDTSYIQNQYSSTETGNFNIASASASAVGAIIQGASSQSANLLNLENSSGAILLYSDASGDLENLGYINNPGGGIGQYGNMLTNSETIGGTGWSLANSETATQSATTAPNNTSTASKLINGGVASGATYATITTSSLTSPYTLSFWAKSGNSSKITYTIYDSTASTNVCTNTVTALTSTWQRYSCTGTPASTGHTLVAYIYADGSTSTTSGNYNYVWGAQVVQASAPGVYTATVGIAISSGTGIVTEGTQLTGSALTFGQTGAATIQSASGKSLTISGGSSGNAALTVEGSAASSIAFGSSGSYSFYVAPTTGDITLQGNTNSGETPTITTNTPPANTNATDLVIEPASASCGSGIQCDDNDLYLLSGDNTGSYTSTCPPPAHGTCTIYNSPGNVYIDTGRGNSSAEQGGIIIGGTYAYEITIGNSSSNITLECNTTDNGYLSVGGATSTQSINTLGTDTVDGNLIVENGGSGSTQTWENSSGTTVDTIGNGGFFYSTAIEGYNGGDLRLGNELSSGVPVTGEIDIGSTSSMPNQFQTINVGYLASGLHGTVTVNLGEQSTIATGSATNIYGYNISIGSTANSLTLGQSGLVTDNAGNFTSSGLVTASSGIATSGSAINTSGGNLSLGSGNITSTGTYNTNTFTSSTLTFGASSAASVSSASGQNLNINGGSNSGAINIGNSSSGTITLQSGGTSVAISSSGDTIQTTTNSSKAYQIQNAGGSAILLVGTTSSNLISNPGFDVNTTGWTATGTGASISRNTTAANTYESIGSLSVTTGTVANSGAETTSFTTSPSGNNSYTLSFYAMASSAFSDLNVTMTATGGTAPTCTLNSTSVVTTGFERYSCTFNPGTGVTVTGIIFGETGTTSHLFYLDAVQLITGSSVTPYNIGTVDLRGVINNPISVESNSNSNTAFQIQNAAGTSNLLVADTIDSVIGIDEIPLATGAALQVSGNISATGTIQGGTINATSSIQANGTAGINVNSCGSNYALVGSTFTEGILTSNGGCSSGTLCTSATNDCGTEDGNSDSWIVGLNTPSYGSGSSLCGTQAVCDFGTSNATNILLQSDNNWNLYLDGSCTVAGGSGPYVPTCDGVFGAGYNSLTFTPTLTVSSNSTNCVGINTTCGSGTDLKVYDASSGIYGLEVGDSGSFECVTVDWNSCPSNEDFAVKAVGASSIALTVQDSTGCVTIDTQTCTEGEKLAVSGKIVSNSAVYATAYDAYSSLGSLDYAEYDTATNPSTVNAGDLVSNDPNNPGQIILSQGDYDSNLIGVISTNPAYTANGQIDPTTGNVYSYLKPLALAGRVPVNVTGENGQIMPGDYITASNTAGYGMKATEPGEVVGMALTGFDGTSSSDTGQVIVEVENFYYTPNIASELQGDNQLTNITLTGNTNITGNLYIGNSQGGLSISASSTNPYEPLLSGTARHPITINLSPQYAGAIIGSNSNGSLTTGICQNSNSPGGLNINTINGVNICANSGEGHTYYAWTTNQSSSQSNDIYVRYQLPSNFNAWAASNPIELSGWTTNAASDKITLSMYDSNGQVCGTSTDITSANGQWQTTPLGGYSDNNFSNCSLSANDTVTLQIHLTAATGDYAIVGDIGINYLSSY